MTTIPRPRCYFCRRSDDRDGYTKPFLSDREVCGYCDLSATEERDLYARHVATTGEVWP